MRNVTHENKPVQFVKWGLHLNFWNFWVILFCFMMERDHSFRQKLLLWLHSSFKNKAQTKNYFSVPIWSNFILLVIAKECLNKWTLCKTYPYSEFSGPYFSALGLHTERYYISLRIQSNCGKIQTRQTPNTDNFNAVEKTQLKHFKSICLTKRIGSLQVSLDFC